MNISIFTVCICLAPTGCHALAHGMLARVGQVTDALIFHKHKRDSQRAHSDERKATISLQDEIARKTGQEAE